MVTSTTPSRPFVVRSATIRDQTLRVLLLEDIATDHSSLRPSCCGPYDPGWNESIPESSRPSHSFVRRVFCRTISREFASRAALEYARRSFHGSVHCRHSSLPALRVSRQSGRRLDLILRCLSPSSSGVDTERSPSGVRCTRLPIASSGCDCREGHRTRDRSERLVLTSDVEASWRDHKRSAFTMSLVWFATHSCVPVP